MKNAYQQMNSCPQGKEAIDIVRTRIGEGWTSGFSKCRGRGCSAVCRFDTKENPFTQPMFQASQSEGIDPFETHPSLITIEGECAQSS